MYNYINELLHVSPIDKNALFGVEIQRPISEKAFEGLRAVLLHTVEGVVGPDAALVELTRYDFAGMALVIERPQGTKYDAEYYAHRIGDLINPCSLHEVSLNY